MASTIDTTAERVYARLSFLIESNDHVGGALHQLIGARDLLALIERQDWFPADLQRRVAFELGTLVSADNPVSFTAALTRWRRRLAYAPDARNLLEAIERVGGGLLLPGQEGWPGQLDDLGHGAPLCLWWRSSDPGRLRVQEQGRNVGIVGSRDSSDYGNQVTRELAAGLARHGICIVSGGAYGIDAAAHRAALETDGGPEAPCPTIAFLAGGLDRLYPAGNANLLRQVIEHGVLLSEVPPGTAPARFRFLNRNRLISAFCHLVVVTEARYRSGALNTARQAVDLGREVAAIPGSVFSPNSVGTHRLVRAGEAGLVTSVQDALELLPARCGTATQPVLVQEPERATDGLDHIQGLVLDVLTRSTANPVDQVCALSGLSAPEALRALHVLRARGQAMEAPGGWKRVGR